MEKKGVFGCLGLLGCLGVSVVALVVVGGAGYFVWKAVKGGDIEEVAALLPADTPMLFGMKGFADLAVEFGGVFDPEKADPETARLRAQVAASGQKELGFDPTDPAAWTATGLDFTRPWAFATLGALDPQQAEYAVFIPVRDETAAWTTLKSVLERQHVPVREQVVGEHTLLVSDVGPAVTAHADFFVVYGSRRRGFDVVEGLVGLVSRDPSQNLADDADFTAALEELGSTWHLFGWMSGPALGVALAELRHDLSGDWLSFGRRGAGGTVALADDAVRSRFSVLNEPGKTLPGIRPSGRDTLGASVGGNALLAARTSLDLPAAWAEAKKTPEGEKKIREMVEGVRAEWGVDLETDLVANLVGDTSVVLLEAPAGLLPVDLVAYTGVKDAPKVTALFDIGSTRLRAAGMEHSVDRAADQVWYSRENIGFGVARNHLVGTYGAGRLAAVRASFASSSPSYLDPLPPEVRRGLESGPSGYLWLDLKRAEALGNKIGRALAAFGGGGAESLDGASALFTGISASVDNNPGATRFETTAWAVPGGLVSALTAQGGQMQKRAARAEAPANVDGILTAERSFHAATGRYAPCGTELEARRLTSAEPREWVAGPCWNDLGWRPEGKVRGGYWVTVDRWGLRMEVHGVIDADGDGKPAEFVASPMQNARMITPADVY